MNKTKILLICGMARAGSTMLTAILNWHSKVKTAVNINKKGNVNDFVTNMLNTSKHINYSRPIENKKLWFQYLPGIGVHKHVGKELIVEDTNLLPDDILDKFIPNDIEDKVFLTKSPVHTFRIKMFRKLIPDIKILALYRDPYEVINSWGGAGSLSMAKQLCRRWTDVLEYLDENKEVGFANITYDQLVDNTQETLKKVLDYFELPYEDYIEEVKVVDRRNIWKERLKEKVVEIIKNNTKEGMKLYNNLKLL